MTTLVEIFQFFTIRKYLNGNMEKQLIIPNFDRVLSKDDVFTYLLSCIYKLTG